MQFLLLLNMDCLCVLIIVYHTYVFCMFIQEMKLDPFFEALSLYQRRNYEKCAEICTELLEKDPYDQVSN